MGEITIIMENMLGLRYKDCVRCASVNYNVIC